MSVMEVKLFGAKAAGRVAIVDEDDFDLVRLYRWRIWERLRPGSRTWGPYAITWISRDFPGSTHYGMHTLITGWSLVDHANGNGLDNRRANLRPATIAQNSQNRRPVLGRTSQYKGVCWNRGSRKWQVDIKVNGKNRYLGVYASEEEAALIYDAAAREAHGEFAYLNFPEVA